MSYNIIINRKNVKSMRARIHQDGRITMSVPFNVTKEEIDKHIEQIKPWIDKNYYKVVDDTLFYDLKDNGYIYILGIKHNIKVILSDKDECFRDNNILYVYVTNKDNVDKNVNEYLRELRVSIFNECLNKYLDILNLKIESLIIKEYKAVYGKCNTKKKIIFLNSQLIHRPIDFIEAICLHEVAHLKEANHSNNFYKIIYNIMPDYKIREKHLKI